MTAVLPRLSHVGLKKEAVPGTYEAPASYIPLMNPQPEDIIAPLRDESIRANRTVLQGQYGGPSQSTYKWNGHLYVDVFGHLLRAILGVDTVAGAGPYTHTFKNTNADPPSYSITDFDGVEAKGFPGCKLGELAVHIDVAGTVTYDASWVGYPSADQSTPSPSFSAVAPLLGWQWTLSHGGVASTRGLKADLTFKRDVDVIHASDGTQGPREVFSPDLEVDGTIQAMYENGTDLDRFLAYTQNATVLTVTSSASAALALTLTTTVMNKAATGRGGKYAVLDFDVSGIYNTTDTGPGHAVLTNSVSAAF
jgi:hypothetical protein